MLSLPATLQAFIFTFLPLQQVFSALPLTCKKFASVCKYDRRIWEGKFLRLKHGNRTLNGDAFPVHCHSSILYEKRLSSRSPLSPHFFHLLTFGGNVSYQNLIEDVQNHLSCFDFELGEWTVQESKNFVSRTEHSIVRYEDSFFLFGGNGGHAIGDYFNDIQAYELPFDTKKEFVTLEVQGDIPSKRSGHSAVVYNGNMYIFGGWRGLKGRVSLNDHYSFNFETSSWRQIPEKGDIPSNRRTHSTVVHKDSMYLFGGFDESQKPQYFNQLYKFQFKTETWEHVQCSGEIPPGRSRAALVVYGHYLYLMGGWDRSNCFCDLYRLNLDTKVWQKIETNLGEIVKGIQQQSCLVCGDWLIVFGGKSGGTTAIEPLSSILVSRLGPL